MQLASFPLEPAKSDEQFGDTTEIKDVVEQITISFDEATASEAKRVVRKPYSAHSPKDCKTGVLPIPYRFITASRPQCQKQTRFTQHQRYASNFLV